MVSSLKRLDNTTFELSIVIPWSDVSKAYQKRLEEIVAETEIEGFRKGKAPREVVEGKLKKKEIFLEVIKDLIPSLYQQTIDKLSLKPISTPKLDIVSMDEGKDFLIRATSCEKPQFDLNPALEEIKKINAAAKIWLPGSDKTQKTEANETKSKEERIAKILEVLLNKVAFIVPELLVSQEQTRILSQTLDEIRALGLKLDEYLGTTNRTLESFRAETRQKAANSLKMEIILTEIADLNNVNVSGEEIDALVNKITDPKQKESLSKNAYTLAFMLRRQKTLDFLLGI